MAFQSLYRRYRPARFADVRGQEHVVAALRNAVRDGTVAHAYLFSGPRGTGKTSTARILAKALNCEAPADGEPCCECESCLAIERGTSLDVSELDAASNNGVEAMRDLISRVSLGSAGRTRLYILDEVHMLSAAAANTLLKTLEEPPAHVIFVLATTDPQKVLPTIRSRTQHFELRLLPAATLEEHLRWVVADAGLAVGADGIEVAVRRGAGSARDALSALDQIVAGGGTAEDDSSIDEMVEALCERDTGRVLVAVAEATAAGRDPRQLAETLLALLRDAFLSLMAPEVVALPDRTLERVADQARRLGPPATVRALDAVGEALLAMRDAPDPRICLEVALVRITRPDTDTAPAALLERIERLERDLRHQGAPHVAVPEAATPSPAPDAAPAPDDEAPAAPAPAAPAGAPGAGGPAAARATLGGLRQARSRPAPPAPTPAAPTPPPPPPARRAATPAADPAPDADAAGGQRAPTDPAAGPGPEATAALDPAPAPLAPAAQAAPAASTAFPDRDQLTVAWADHVIGSLRPATKARFLAGRFVGVESGRALFALPNEAHREQCEGRRADVEAALAAHFGCPVPLRLVVEAESAGAAGGAATAADGSGSEDDAVDLEGLSDAPADGRSEVDRITEAFPGTELIDE